MWARTSIIIIIDTRIAKCYRAYHLLEIVFKITTFGVGLMDELILQYIYFFNYIHILMPTRLIVGLMLFNMGTDSR